MVLYVHFGDVKSTYYKVSFNGFASALTNIYIAIVNLGLTSRTTGQITYIDTNERCQASTNKDTNDGSENVCMLKSLKFLLSISPSIERGEHMRQRKKSLTLIEPSELQPSRFNQPMLF